MAVPMVSVDSDNRWSWTWHDRPALARAAKNGMLLGYSEVRCKPARIELMCRLFVALICLMANFQ